MYFDDGVALNRFSAGSLNFHNHSPPEYQGSKSLAVGFFFSEQPPAPAIHKLTLAFQA
jgi:hypothetical protein